MTATEDLTRYRYLCDAVRDQIRADVGNCPFKGRVKVEVPAWVEWARSRLKGYGMDAAANDCGRYNLAEYCSWIAREAIMSANPHYPEFATPAILSGDAELDYWRAVTIAAEMKSIPT